jgi:chromosome segregation ATPase/DNA-binding XRE family transcriptional regulator
MDELMDQIEVGERIREARRTSSLTQMALAERLGVPLGTIERLESGMADPTPFLETIADATATPVAWLRGGGSNGSGHELDAAMESIAERGRALSRVEARVREAGDALERRWAELRDKEAEQRRISGRLAEREAALAERAQQVEAAAGASREETDAALAAGNNALTEIRRERDELAAQIAAQATANAQAEARAAAERTRLDAELAAQREELDAIRRERDELAAVRDAADAEARAELAAQRDEIAWIRRENWALEEHVAERERALAEREQALADDRGRLEAARDEADQSEQRLRALAALEARIPVRIEAPEKHRAETDKL